jgi:hypothetical protein
MRIKHIEFGIASPWYECLFDFEKFDLECYCTMYCFSFFYLTILRDDCAE